MTSIPQIKEKARVIVTHAGFRKYFKNTGWMFAAKLASMAVSFVATAYIARNLGPYNYGQLSYAISFTSLFGVLASLGIDQVLFRDLVKFPEKRDAYLGSALIVRLLTGTTAVLSCIVLAYFLSPHDISLFLIFILSLTFVFNSFQLIGFEFQAKVEAKYASITSIIAIIILNILKITVIAFGKGVIYMALILLLEPVIYAIGYIYFKNRVYGRRPLLVWDKHIAKSILSESWPLIFSSAFAAIYARVDQVLIKNMINAESVGVYDAAVRLSEVWYFIPNIIIASLFPAIINAQTVSFQLYARRLKNVAAILFSLTFVIALPITIFSRMAMSIVFGPAFMAGAAVLQIYVWSDISTSLGSLASYYLIAEGKTKIITYSTFLAMLTNVLLNLWWIPHYGIIGSAWATFLSYLLVPCTLLVFPSTRREIVRIFQTR